MRADDEDVVGPLRESIAAAPVILEGEAGRSYTSWDGADPATIRTYTPFTVTRVLKGVAPAAHLLLRQAGGEVAGASAVIRGAEFSEGEQAIVFLGAANPADRSYDVAGGRRGKFVVQRDDEGRAVLDVRLGADAAAYGRAEKAPGTGLARVPVELFEQLAAGTPSEPLTGLERAPDRMRSAGPTSQTGQTPPPTAASGTRPAHSNLLILSGLAVLAALIAVAWMLRGRIR